MLRTCILVAVVAVMASAVWAAEKKKEDVKKDWPTKAAIEKAEDRVEWEKDKGKRSAPAANL